ncbi:MAG TPA: SDR family oxidoreductase [Candidatus Saccharimonadia bacterium]|nr:SDR family oxidoreductase [Candidatus Saccharimonadia bacterium]
MAERLVAVTGASGRLGQALVAHMDPTSGLQPLAWGRPAFDLDDPASGARLVERDRPSVVVHTAAWTDVDGCARQPELAGRRNGHAVGALAVACAARGADLIIVSTNEVFDGRRTDRRGYSIQDAPNPINPYGASKLEGETRARTAYDASSAGGRLAIVRTSWLFGPPGGDFPTKILAAAETAGATGQPLRVVDDEFGSPTSTSDLAVAIVALILSDVPPGIHHFVDTGIASRFEWASLVLGLAGRSQAIEPVSSSSWSRASSPPAWGVLEPSPLAGGLAMPTWQAATAVYVATLMTVR